MRFVDSRTGIDLLAREECLALLAGDEIGRIAVVAGGAPVILPVNYALDGEAIVFRTSSGTKLDAGPRAPACFEIDSFDRERREGWSVVVAGRLEELDRYQPMAYERAKELGIEPWAGPGRDHWMRLVPSRITGRRVTH